MIKISQRAQQLPFSPIRKLVPFANKAKSKGIKVYHLNIGQPDIPSPKIFLTKVKTYKEKIVAYEQSDGNASLKKSLATYYQHLGLKINAEDIIITQGGSEALWMAFFILLGAGEECLTLEPFYTNYLSFVDLVGVKLKAITTFLEDNFQLPPIEKIKKAIGSRTRAIIINSPSNPTGAIYSSAMLKNLVDFCVKKKIFIITDETYREFAYDGEKAVSLLSFAKGAQITVLADSFSKRYSLCGARLGCLVSKNKKVIEAALKIGQARLAVASIEQYAASFLHQTPKSYFEKINAEYKSRRDVLMANLSKIPEVKFGRPSGAFYLIAQLPVTNAEDFCQFLLEKFNYKGQTVMLAPAEGFYATPGLGRNQVRIAYVLRRQDLKKACFILQKALQEYRKK